MKNVTDKPRKEIPSSGKAGKITRAGMNLAGGAIPFLGGILSAAAGAWSESEQQKVNQIFQQWLQMLEDELNEKATTIAEIMARLDMQDAEIIDRIESPEYQVLLKKTFRRWSSIDSESKRQKIRNLLANAAATSLSSDDVVSLFIEWLSNYSDFHFEVIGEIYRSPQVSRGAIWRNLKKPEAREDSAEADLYKLLFRDLSTGGVIRQHRETDYHGNFVKRRTSTNRSRSGTLESAFENDKGYVLTELGQQFVHYAMNELAPRIEFEK